MIKRVSLVWKRPELTRAQFGALWVGEHVHVARQLPGLREYVIDFATEPAENCPDGIATLRFDDQRALEAAFADSKLNEALVRTRDAFAVRVQVMIVEEHVIVARTQVT